MKDTELLNNRLLKLQQDYDTQLSAAEQLAQENNQRAVELRVSDFFVMIYDSALHVPFWPWLSMVVAVIKECGFYV